VGGRGIALGFEISRNLGTGGVLEVKYEDSKLQSIGDDPNLIPKELHELLLVTKFKHWEYEKEVRVLVELSKTCPAGKRAGTSIPLGRTFA